MKNSMLHELLLFEEEIAFTQYEIEQKNYLKYTLCINLIDMSDFEFNETYFSYN